MFFKNARVYQLSKPFPVSAEQLSTLLEEQQFEPCKPHDVQSIGWVPPLGEYGKDFVHAGNGRILVCLKLQEKVIPSAAIKEKLQEKIQEIQERDERKVGRKERLEIRDEIIIQTLPVALTKSTLIYAYISLESKLLVVNAPGESKAELVVTELRQVLESFGVRPATTSLPPADAMTDWLMKRTPPESFQFGYQCQLKDMLDTSCVIKYQNCSVDLDEIRSQIEGSMLANRLELSHNGLEFVVDDSLAIKRIRFSDVLQEQAAAIEAEDYAQVFDSEFTVMTAAIDEALDQLFASLNGLEAA